MCRPPATVDGGAAPPPLGKEFLAEAPRAVCAVVCGLYLALSCRGATHLRRIIADGHADPDALFRDFGALLALYGAETALAAAGGATTMYHWTRRNFLEHHLPLALVGGCMLACCGATQGRALVQHEEWCSLILLISFNEASAAFLILRPDPTLQAFRIGPNLLIQVSLLATELGSYARAMRAQRAPGPAMALPNPVPVPARGGRRPRPTSARSSPRSASAPGGDRRRGQGPRWPRARVDLAAPPPSR
ncbi:hypothetical protein JL722_2330 [Aureococcus anophagefferens]|nr:hypothetical protein JL722_2330 [Aureococcus anophagefferens]